MTSTVATTTTASPAAEWLTKVQEKSVAHLGPDQVTAAEISTNVPRITTRIGPAPRYSTERGRAVGVCSAARDTGRTKDVEIRASDGLTALAWTGAGNTGCKAYQQVSAETGVKRGLDGYASRSPEVRVTRKMDDISSSKWGKDISLAPPTRHRDSSAVDL